MRRTILRILIILSRLYAWFLWQWTVRQDTLLLSYLIGTSTTNCKSSKFPASTAAADQPVLCLAEDKHTRDSLQSTVPIQHWCIYPERLHSLPHPRVAVAPFLPAILSLTTTGRTHDTSTKFCALLSSYQVLSCQALFPNGGPCFSTACLSVALPTALCTRQAFCTDSPGAWGWKRPTSNSQQPLLPPRVIQPETSLFYYGCRTSQCVGPTLAKSEKECQTKGKNWSQNCTCLVCIGPGYRKERKKRKGNPMKEFIVKNFVNQQLIRNTIFGYQYKFIGLIH